MPILAKTAEIFIGVCLPILLVVAGGWAAGKRFRLDLDSLVALNIRFFVPAFIFVRLYESPLPGAEALKIIGFTFAQIVAIGLLVLILCAAIRPSPGRKNSILLGSIFYNCGNFGIPLVTLAYGAGAQPVQVFVLMTMNIATFTLGTFLAAGGNSTTGWPRWFPILKQPSLYAIAIALLSRQFFPGVLTEVTPLWEPLALVASGLVPLALVTLGVQLAHTKPPPLRGDLSWVLLLRLVAAPAVAAVLVMLFDFPPETRAILIAGAAAPTPVNVALLTHDLRGDSRFASASVFYSTLLSALTVSVVLAFIA